MSKKWFHSLWLAVVVMVLLALPVTVFASRTWPTQQQGDSGRNVVTIQYLLRARGYSLTVDGSFGTTTKSKVVSFQQAKGLSADGVVGNNTWEALIITVQQGDNSDAVRAVQDQLKNRYGYNLTIDGAFGSGTKSAVVSFQQSKGLTADGIVGPNTWVALVGGSGNDGGGFLTHAQALSQLTAAGIPVSSSGNCSDRNNSSCTSLDQIRQSTISGVINFKAATGCAITVTGGTETGHASGTYSHWNGYKVDVAITSCVTNYITSHYTYIGGSKYTDPAGNVYYNEVNHWDITYY